MLSLDHQDATDATSCGHKAATLARLRQAGHDVPAGFVIPVGHTDVLDEAAIAGALAQLNGPVAVRSSGLAEDSADASFAGQYDSFLSVQGLDAVLSAIGKCVRSQNSDRALTYAGSAAVAVLIQEMVKADAAGVAFSKNPMTGNRDEVLVSATKGLGDRLLGGEVDGDEWSVSDGHATSIAKPQGAIDQDAVLRVAALARLLEEQLGFPQDVEWAMVGERLVVLQARPITVLPTKPAIEIPKGTWQKDTAHYSDLMSPFGSIVLGGYDAALEAMIESWGLLPDAIYNRTIAYEVYTHAEPDDGGKAPPPWWLLGLVARVVPSLRRKLKRAQQVIDEGKLSTTPPRWEAEFKPELIRGIETFEAVDLTALNDAQLFDHLGRLKTFGTRAAGIHFELFVPYLIGLHGLVVRCEELLGWKAPQVLTLLQGLSVASSAPTRKLEQIAEIARTRAAARAVIQAGGPNFFDRLRHADAEVSSHMDEYLRRWGLRPIEYDAGSPSLREQPELVASLLCDLLEPREGTVTPQTKRDSAVADARRQLSNPEARRHFDEALAFAEQVYPQREDNVLYTDNLISGLFRLAALEFGRRLVTQGRLKRQQDAVLLTEEQLRGALADRGVDTISIVNRVRSEMAWVRANPGPLVYGPEPGSMPNLRGLPEPTRRLNGALLWAMAEELAPAKTSNEGGITGLPSSPGVTVGTVRIVRTSSEIHHVRQGDVVVCPTATPAWTVIFQRAAALVADGGSALCHAAIVAREHGIPAVVATGNGTSRLRNGQRVQVDGNRGTITLLDDFGPTRASPGKRS